MKNILLAWSFLFLRGASLFAQCIITGNIIDNANEPLSFAHVIVENLKDNAQIVVMADDNGFFCVKNVKPGNYQLTISRVGSETYTTKIVVTSQDAALTLNDIKINNLSTRLSEVTVIGSVHVSEIKPAAIKYKTSSLISETGGTAGDILKNMPSVAMGGSPGHNRDIRFRGLGNAYTKVLINGREIGLSGNNRETVLDQIPAASISHIEILAVPGSEFQSEGINGIVNIVLKDNAQYGIHGKVEALAGNEDGLGGGLSLSNKTEKFNFYAHYDFLQRSIPKPKVKTKIDYKDGAISQIEDSYELENKKFNNHNLRTGFDTYLMHKTKLTGEYIMGYQLEDKDRTLDYIRTDANGNFKSSAQELKTEYKPNHFHHFYSALEHTFVNSAKFFLNVGHQIEEQKKTEEKQTYALTQAGKWANFQPTLENKDEKQTGNKSFWNAGLSKYTLAGNTFTLGYSGEIESRKFTNTTDKFNYADTSWKSSNNGFDNFKVNEKTHVFYLSDEINIAFIKLKAGIRYESTKTIAEAGADSLDATKSYKLILPSATAIFNLDKTQYVSFNFGRRIRRPGFKDLNPYTEQKEPTKFAKGNPALKPELAWAYELGYFKNFNQFNLGTNLFYRDISNVIQKTIKEDDNNIITEQPENTGSAYVIGIEVMSTLKPFNFWQLTASYSQFYSEITSGEYQGDALNDQFKWTTKVITDFNLPQNWTLQFSFNFVGPKVSNNKEEGTIWYADAGLEKRILSNGILSIRMTDIFDSLKKDKVERTNKSTTNETEYTTGRIFLIGLSWKF